MTKVTQRWFCKCVTKAGEEVTIVIKALTQKEACAIIHESYKVDYIEDILTPLQMDYAKRHLRPTLTATNVLQ